MKVNSGKLWFAAGLLAVGAIVGSVAHSRAQNPADGAIPHDGPNFAPTDDLAFQPGPPEGRGPRGPRPDGPPSDRPRGEGPRSGGPRGDGPPPGGPPGFGRGPQGGPPEMLVRRLEELNHKLDIVLREIQSLKVQMGHSRGPEGPPHHPPHDRHGFHQRGDGPPPQGHPGHHREGEHRGRGEGGPPHGGFKHHGHERGGPEGRRPHRPGADSDGPRRPGADNDRRAEEENKDNASITQTGTITDDSPATSL